MTYYLVSAGLDATEGDDDVLPGEHLLQHLTAGLLDGRVQVQVVVVVVVVQVVVRDAQLVHELRYLAGRAETS